MFNFISNLFSTETTTPSRKVQLGLTAMEDRYTPASLVVNPGTIRGFNPQPEPPLVRIVIIAIQPATTHGLIVEGG